MKDRDNDDILIKNPNSLFSVAGHCFVIAQKAVELCPCGLCLIREPGDVGGNAPIIDQIQWILWVHPNEKTNSIEKKCQYKW